MIGQTISHYRIVEKLGEGGMGVVYKAEDTQLRRTVALKFLTPQSLNESETKARLIREAQAAASLDHPNICSVHGIHEEDGHTFIAMAYIDGVSLADKIKQRPLAFEEALNIAIQIGEGLQEAHEKGVVHRDIKPANIMLTRKDRVKIMDFGLAYLAGRSKLTKSGTTLGTPVYMSPEQALGQPADRRSDIWSLGVVLYEMIAGQPPFNEEHEQAIVYSILNEAPEPLTARRTGLPVEIDRVIGKVLAKKPDDRYQHVDDLAVDLKNLREKPKSGQAAALRTSVSATTVGARHAVPAETETATGARAQHAVPLQPSRREWAAWGLIAVLLGICIWLAATALREPEARPNQTTAFSIVPSAAGPSAFGNLALSPDGASLVFAAADASGARKLWLRRLDSPDAQPLEGTEGAIHAFWSPDGRFVAFMTGQKLRKMEVPGGAPVDICNTGIGRGGTWNASGLIVLQPTSREPLQVVSSSGGELSPVTELSAERSENSHRYPRFLPDGRHFLYTARATPENTAIYVGSLASKQAKRILTAQSNAAYAPPHDGIAGQLLFVRDGVLFAQPFDAQTLATQGEAVVVARGLRYNTTGSYAPFTVSGGGRVLTYVRGGGREIDLIWFDRNGNAIRKYERAGSTGGMRLAPDGERAMVSRSDPYGGNRDLWLVDLSSGSVERFTTDPGNDWVPVWSPTGDRILFASDRDGGQNSLYVQRSSGAAEAGRLLAERDFPNAPEDWSPDGKFVAYIEESNHWILPLEGDQKPIPFVQNGTGEQDIKFSPDGRWVAYTSRVSGEFEVYVHSMADAISGRAARSPGRKVSFGGGVAPRWRRDGKELFYIRPDETLMSAEMGPTGAASPKTLFRTCPGSFRPVYWDARYDVALDGQRFLFNCPAETDEEPEIRVVVNWAAALK